jgi:DNA-binding NarL/FixJ family response regulator
MLAGAACGEAVIAPELANRILSELASKTDRQATDLDDQPDPSLLTPRQAEVLGLVARGLTYKEVAASLHLSEATIKYHMGQILSILQLASRREAIAYARQFNLDK